MIKTLSKLILIGLSLATLNTYASQEKEVDIYEYEGGWRRYEYNINIECGIFQFKEVKANSAKEKLNAKLLETFLKLEADARENCLKTANREPLDDDDIPYKFFYRGDIRGRSYVYINKANLFSARNEIYCERGMGAFVRQEGINYKILENGEIEKIEIEDLFIAGENCLDPLLIEAVNTLNEDKLWDSDAKAAIEEILNFKREEGEMTKQEYYIYSFALKEDSLVLIIQSMSLMPNAGGYPIVEIPFKKIKHLKDLDFIK
ncbi:MAG: hypothetical protein R3Y46_07555 [Opitutales bacterium]